MNPQDVIKLLHVELSLTSSEVSKLDDLEKRLGEETRKRNEVLQQNNLLLQKRISYTHGSHLSVATSIRGKEYAIFPVSLAAGLVGRSTECYIYDVTPTQRGDALMDVLFIFPLPLVRKAKIGCENKDVYNNFCTRLNEELEERIKKAEGPKSNKEFIKVGLKRKLYELPKELRSFSEIPLDEAIYDVLYQEDGDSYLTHVIVGRDTESSLESFSLPTQFFYR